MTRICKTLHVALLAVAFCGCVYHPIPSEVQEECGADSPRVGQVAELTNRFIHGISGTARIVDNCTIVVENFYYDGIAADARFVGVVNNDWTDIAVLTGPMMRAGGYQNERIVISLPKGVTLDDIEMISLCCLPGLDFLGSGSLADGVFHNP